MKLSFIIPVFNDIEFTRACVSSLQETIGELSYEILIVDDCSETEIANQLRQLESDKIQVIANTQNGGYAYANNVGATYATGDILFLLNNDLLFLPGWIEPMLKAFNDLPTLGIIGNVQIRADDGRVDHMGGFVDLDTTLKHRTSRKTGRKGISEYSKAQYVTGACCAIRRDLYLLLGGFDETFVNGCEDADLCFRLSDLGYKIMVANKSVVKHHVGATRGIENEGNEWNSRIFQARWRHRIAKLAALHWPERYISQVSKRWSAANRKLLWSALLRYLRIKGGPAPIAIENALCELDRREIHWKAKLDSKSDDLIRTEERRANARVFKDSYQIDGLYSGSEHASGVWIRERAVITIPRGTTISESELIGTIDETDPDRPESAGKLGISITVNSADTRVFYPMEPGSFKAVFGKPPVRANTETRIEIELLGVTVSNACAYLGRILQHKSFIPLSIRKRLAKYRLQLKNRRLRIRSLRMNGEEVFDFEKDPTNPINTEYVLRHSELGINLVGWFKAQLGIGESVRLAAKALKAGKLLHQLVPLKVNCLADQGDTTYDNELTDDNPYPINVFHIDAPQCGDIDHHHGDHFRSGKYNVAYWAWELPEFPDQWTRFFDYFDEVWTPSNFARDAIVMKSPLPVITVPHCIDFEEPKGDYREALDLPKDKFLFTFAYDLNSYQERKNPKAAIEAFKLAFAGSDRENDTGLVIKIQSSRNNPDALQELQESLDGIANYYLIDKTLSREAVYGLMQASDAYISLHRSEGFGLTLAESMFLGKPVVSTDWSATTEFVNAGNACPVKYTLKKLERHFGPYAKGQIWADPDPEDAAAHMYRLANDSELALNLGYNARQTIRQRFSPETIGGIYRRRLRAIALW